MQPPPQPFPPKPRRRPEPLRSVSGGIPHSRNPALNSEPSSLIFPPYSPYNDIPTLHSPPTAFQRRVHPASQPNTPSFHAHTQQHHLDERPASTIPHPSTAFPPTTLRHPTSVKAADDSDLEDDEFHLFAEATAGLGPEQAFRTSFESSSSSGPGILHASSFHNPSLPTTQPPSPPPPPLDPSPNLFTPTIRTAIHHIAQMPEAYHDPVPPPPSSRLPHRSISPSRPARPSVSPSRLETWLARADDEQFFLPPEDDRGAEGYEVSPIENHDDGNHDDETHDENHDDENDGDELPTYATSQAQAQEGRRVEAARRAQELARKWRERMGY